MKKKILLLFAALFLMIPSAAKADVLSGFTLPTNIYTQDNNGTSVSSGKVSDFVHDPTLWDYDYFSIEGYNYQANGIFVNIPLDQTLLNGNRYVVQTAFNGSYGLKRGNFSSGLAPVNSIYSNPYNYTNKVDLKSFTCENKSVYISTQTDSELTVCTIDFIYTATYQPQYISVPINSKTSGKSQFVQFLGYSIQNLGKDYSTDLNNIKTSIGDIKNNINNSITNSTNSINNSITNSTNTINDSIQESNNQINDKIDDMGNSINQNINDNFQNCHDSVNLFDGKIENGGYNINTGVKTSGSTLIRNVNSISVDSNTNYIFSNDGKGIAVNVFEYKSDNTFIKRTVVLANSSFVTSSDTKYINFYKTDSGEKKIQLEKGTKITSYEPYGEVCTNRIDETNEALGDINNSITDSSVDTSSSNSFFGDFTNNDHGLSSIITAPLNFIKSLTSSSCSPLSLTIPFVNQTLNLPCMNTVYSNFNQLYTLYQTITFGIISYWVCVRIYALVKSFKDPEDDRIEVVDL